MAVSASISKRAILMDFQKNINNKQNITNNAYGVVTEALPNALFRVKLDGKEDIVMAYLAGKMEGTTGRQRLSKKVLSDSIINLPSLKEQKKIVNVLTSIQTSIFEQDRLILKLKELKHSMLHQLFTYGTKGEKTKVTDIGEIPESWNLITVKEAIDRSIIEKPIDGNHGNIHPKSKDFIDSGIPFIMASDLIGNSVDIKKCHFISKSQADKLQKGFSLEGDILLSHKATIGRTAIVHSLTTEYLMLTPQVTYYRVKDKNKLQNYYLRHFFDSSGFQSTLKNIAGDGSTRAYIGILKQQILPIVLPSLDEQIKITKSLDALDNRIESANVKLFGYKDLFKTLLHELMSGKRRIN